MNLVSLQRLIRHAYSDGTCSYHYALPEVNKAEVPADWAEADLADDPADRFTDWPPQPMIAWLES